MVHSQPGTTTYQVLLPTRYYYLPGIRPTEWLSHGGARGDCVDWL